MNEKEQIEYAKSLLQSDGISLIFQTLEDSYINAWKDCAFTDGEKKQELHAMVKALTALRNEISSIAKSEDVKLFNLRLASTNKMR